VGSGANESFLAAGPAQSFPPGLNARQAKMPATTVTASREMTVPAVSVAIKIRRIVADEGGVCNDVEIASLNLLCGRGGLA